MGGAEGATGAPNRGEATRASAGPLREPRDDAAKPRSARARHRPRGTELRPRSPMAGAGRGEGLLLQPHGFEGFGPVGKESMSRHLLAAEGEAVIDAHLDLD